MSKLVKGKSVNKLRVKILIACLCILALVTGICLSTFKKDSNADTLDTSIKSHKSIKRDINMKVNSAGELLITKPNIKNEKMGKEDKWTLFFYVVDSGYGTEKCYELLNNFKDRYVGESIKDCLDIVIQCCPSEEADTKEFEINKQVRAKITSNGFEVIETSDKSNMGEAETLYEFLNWGVENYASEHMMVNILSNSYNSLNGRYGLAEDSKYSDGLQIYEIEEAFARQSQNMTCRFDGILLNQYDSGMAEYANLLSPYVEKMIGLSEADGTNIWDYSIIEQAIEMDTDITFEELGKIICDAYDYQCSLDLTGKDYSYDDVLAIDTKYNEYETSSYGIGLYNLDKIDDFTVAINDVMYDIYTELSKSSDLETIKEFSELSSNIGSCEFIQETSDINVFLNALTKLVKIHVDVTKAKEAVKELVVYSRCGNDNAAEDKIQMTMFVKFFSIDYEHYFADEVNFCRNMVLSPYVLKTIDYLYAIHWDMDTNATYKWETSDYYFEDNFGFIPSDISITQYEGDVSDEMYTSKSLNEATFLEFFDQKYPEYEELTDVWKTNIKILDTKRWVSFSKSQYKKNNKYYAHAFMEFKDLQEYWEAYNAAYLDSDNGHIMLGEQTGATIDNETGIMSQEFNYEWVMLADGQFVKTNIEKNIDKTTYNIPVYMDDEDVTIRIEENIENGYKKITVLGVYDAKAKDKICDLESGMVITPVYDVYDYKTSEYQEDACDIKEPWVIEYGEEYTVSGKDDFLYGKLPEDKVTCSFAIMKYNGSIYYDVSNVDDMEKLCLVGYTDNVSRGESYNFEILNNLLRGKELSEDIDIEKANNRINTISEALQKAQLLKDMTLYRGCSKNTLGEYKDLSAEELIGKTIVEPGFLSTTTEKSVAENFAKNLIITIHAKKGDHGLSLKNISEYMAEEEILFDKNQQLEITAAEEIEGIMYIDVTIK